MPMHVPKAQAWYRSVLTPLMKLLLFRLLKKLLRTDSTLLWGVHAFPGVHSLTAWLWLAIADLGRSAGCLWTKHSG